MYLTANSYFPVQYPIKQATEDLKDKNMLSKYIWLGYIV